MPSEFPAPFPLTHACIEGVCNRETLRDQLAPVSRLIREGRVEGEPVLIECRSPRIRPRAVGVFYQELTALLVGRPSILVIANAPEPLQHTLSGLTRHFADRTSIVFADTTEDAHGHLLRHHLQRRLTTPIPFRSSPDRRRPLSHPTAA